MISCAGIIILNDNLLLFVVFYKFNLRYLLLSVLRTRLRPDELALKLDHFTKAALTGIISKQAKLV
jgi:hypothetical protein